MPGNVRAVLRLHGIERLPGVLPRRRGGSERTRGDHFRRREAPLPLREPRRIAVARRAEERVRLVDAVVDDADLHAVAGRRQGRAAPELVGADDRRASIERHAVAPSHVHAFDPLDAGELRDVAGCEGDGEAVQHDRVAPPDLRGGDSGANAPLDGLLRRSHVGEIRAARRRVEVEPPRLHRRRQHAARLDGARERRRFERDHDLRAIRHGAVGRAGGDESGGGDRQEQGSHCPSHGNHGGTQGSATGETMFPCGPPSFACACCRRRLGCARAKPGSARGGWYWRAARGRGLESVCPRMWRNW